MVGPRRILTAFALLSLLAATGAAQGEDPATVRIHVVSNGWHAGLVLPLDDEVIQACPSLEDFRGHKAVEIGWGDEGFYRANPVTFVTAFKAVFWPTPTVMHVVSVDRDVLWEFTGADVVALDLPAADFRRMVKNIASVFAGPETLGEGLYGEGSLFYRARGSYYFPNTCNVWLLRVLKDAGVSVHPLLGTRAPATMAQIAAQGTVLRMNPPEPRWPLGLAWLVGLLFGLVCQRRAARQERRTWMGGNLLVAWGAAVLGLMVTLGLLLASANAPDLAAARFGVRGGLGLLCLALGLAAWVAVERLRHRRRLREVLTALVSAVWVFLVMAGA